MTEQNNNVVQLDDAVPVPTAFGAAVMDICLERGIGNPANLELLEERQHDWSEALEDHFGGDYNAEHHDLVWGVAMALGLDLHNEAPERDRIDRRRLASAYVYDEELYN